MHIRAMLSSTYVSIKLYVFIRCYRPSHTSPALTKHRHTSHITYPTRSRHVTPSPPAHPRQPRLWVHETRQTALCYPMRSTLHSHWRSRLHPHLPPHCHPRLPCTRPMPPALLLPIIDCLVRMNDGPHQRTLLGSHG